MNTSETTTHTKGPWRIGDAGTTIFGTGPSPQTIATIRWAGGNTRANARLIAAAPSLLTALQGLLSLADNENLYEEWKAEFTAAENAIQQATGRIYVCQSCATKRGLEHTLNYRTLIGGVPSKLIRTPSTRLKTCFDCGRKYRDIYRITYL